MESIIENPIIEPKELPASPIVEVQTLIPASALQAAVQTIDDDDDCVICYQTIYRPARTECNHCACESCMLHWALSAMDIKADHSTLPTNLSIDGIKFKCPTCRTYTSAHFDPERNTRLQARYPEAYATRAAEVEGLDRASDDESATQTMLLMYGNSHRTIPPSISPETGKVRTHEWTFFVASSRQDLIEKVEVILHPTYRDKRLRVLTAPPFVTTSIGWGYFTIFAGVQLKEGWQWVDEAMVVDSDAEKDRIHDKLPLQWLLDFRENGGQGNRLVKVRKVKGAEQKGKGPADEDEVVKGVGKESADLSESEEELDLGPLADLMSDAEIKQFRETRRAKARAKKEREALERHTKERVVDKIQV